MCSGVEALAPTSKARERRALAPEELPLFLSDLFTRQVLETALAVFLFPLPNEDAAHLLTPTVQVGRRRALDV